MSKMNFTQNLNNNIFNNAAQRFDNIQNEDGTRSSGAKRCATSLITVPFGAAKKAARLGLQIIKFIATPLTFLPTPKKGEVSRFQNMKAYGKAEGKKLLRSIQSLAVSPFEMIATVFSPLVLAVAPQKEKQMALKFAQINRNIEAKISPEEAQKYEDAKEPLLQNPKKVWSKKDMATAPLKAVANQFLWLAGKEKYKYKTGEEQA